MLQSLLPVPHRSQVARAFKDQGGLVAAVLPIHYPRALLRAFGILPMEVWGPPKVDSSHGAAHLQPYVCSIVSHAISFLLSGGLEVADLILVPHACDSLQGLGSVLIDFIHPRQPVLTLYLPRATRESDVVYLAQELRYLHRRLADITGRNPNQDDLRHSVQREEAADAVLARLHQVRKFLPYDEVDVFRLIRSREFLPSEHFVQVAEWALSQTGETPRPGTPILISGIVPEPMTLFKALSEMGAVTVGDDLACCGRRLYPPSPDGDPFRGMALSLLSAPPDPTRGSPIHARLEHLKTLAAASGARGVIFYDVKFCEPELFDLPLLRRGLQAAGIPSLSVEVDLDDPFPQQVINRIEAFLEMIA